MMKRQVPLRQVPLRQVPLRQVPLREPHPAHRYRGITLLELIIAMVITAILASIAIPSYSSYIRKSRRTDAKTALLDMASLEERFFSANNLYSNQATDLGYGGPWPVTVGSGYYQIQDPTPNIIPATAPTAALPAGTPASYTLIAVPIGDQVNDAACLNFTLTSSGVKGSTGTIPNDPTCWN